MLDLVLRLEVSHSTYFKTFIVLFGHEGKQLDKEAKVNFKMCKVTNWANDY